MGDARNGRRLQGIPGQRRSAMSMETRYVLVTGGSRGSGRRIVLKLARLQVARRMLRPLRTMNTAIKRISARNIRERLALRGPRDELRNLAATVDELLECS